ncbi:MAG TPA: YfhO family protein, partial [Armatimonadota bacterium]|nr:YfhO family protein [Armatimonadota bacterium]
ALAGAAVWWVCRNLGLGRGGALLAAAIYTFSGYQAAHLIHLNFILAAAHLPLMLAVLQTALARSTGVWWALLALEVAAAFLGSHPQVFVMGLTVCGLWVVFGHRWRAEGGAWQRIAGLVAAAVCAGLLVMPQLLPTLELGWLSRRIAEGGGAAAYMASYPFHLRDLARVLLPCIFGTVHENIIGGGPAFHETSAFLGAAPVLLGVLGLIVARRRRGYGFAVAVFIVGAALMPGEGNPLHVLLARLPFMAGFRAMGRWALLPILSVALLGGMAVTWLPRADQRLRGITARVITGLAAVITLAFLALWYTFAVDASGAQVWPGHPHLAVPIRAPADAVFNCMVGWEPILLLVALGATIAVVATVARTGRMGRPALALLLIAVAAPMWQYWQVTNSTVPRKYYTEPPHTARAILREGLGRITTLPPDLVDPEGRAALRPGYRDDRPELAPRELLTPALATVFGIPYADGYKQGLVTPSTLTTWDNYRHYGVQAFSGQYTVTPETVELYGTPAERMKRMHTLCAVQYIVTPGEIEDPDLQVVSEGPVRVYRYRQQHPRAWLATRPVTIADPDAQLELVKRREFDPYRDVVVDRDCPYPAEAVADDTGSVVLAISESERVVARVTSARGGVLVLADAWYPGWVAAVDGRPAELMRADYALRGVAVPPGEHEVQMRFTPRSWRLGLALLALGLALTAALAAWRRDGGRHDPA